MPSPGADLLPALTDAVNRRDFVVPAYPAAALRLRRLMATDNYSVAQVSEVISADPALAAAVLRLANSPLYRPDGPPITALGRAIHRVGLRSLSTIATAAGVGAQACARGPLLDLKYAVWHRAVSCALIGQKLAAAHQLDSEEAFLAGLLYGFGRTVAAACLEAFLATNPASPPLSAEQWFAIADQHRAQLAKAVAERWELPAELAAAIGASETETPLKKLLAIADDFARSLEHNLPDGEASYPAQDQRLLRELRPVLAGAIAALVEAPAGNRPPPPSAVAKPLTALKGELRALDLGVADARSKSAAPLHANAISADGLRLDSKYPFQESTLAHLNLQRADSLLSLWVSVVLCAPQPNGFRVEVQLFSPSRELRGEWASLFEACPKA